MLQAENSIVQLELIETFVESTGSLLSFVIKSSGGGGHPSHSMQNGKSFLEEVLKSVIMPLS